MQERDSLLEAVLASGVKLPSPSQTLLYVQALAGDSESGAAELAEVIGRDPALAGEFIRVANSPVFRTRTPARTVRTALTLLGRTRALAVIASSALRAELAGVAPRAVHAVWSASAATAGWAYRAARASRLPALADLAYLAGLMHDVGIPIVLHRFQECTEAFDAAGGPLDASVPHVDAAALHMDAVTGASHAAVGCLVARNWKLPAEVAEAIALHHSPAAAEQAEPHAASLATLIAVGRHLRDGRALDWEAWAPLAEAHLHLDSAGLEMLAAGPDAA